MQFAKIRTRPRCTTGRRSLLILVTPTTYPTLASSSRTCVAIPRALRLATKELYRRIRTMPTLPTIMRCGDTKIRASRDITGTFITIACFTLFRNDFTMVVLHLFALTWEAGYLYVCSGAIRRPTEAPHRRRGHVSTSAFQRPKPCLRPLQPCHLARRGAATTCTIVA